MSSKITTWLLALTLLLMVGVYWELHSLRSVVKDFGSILQQGLEIHMDGTLHHDFKSGGQVYNVDTVRQDTETKAAWRARHLSEIQAAWALHPPD